MYSEKLSLNRVWDRWSRWEFWPASVAMLPVYGMGVLLALRARRMLFFTNLNPAIPLSGAVGESKINILNLLPAHLVPPTLVVDGSEQNVSWAERLAEAGMHFPVVAKPDVGERGFLVRVCRNDQQLQAHLDRHPTRFLLQPFINLSEEYSVFFYHFPNGGPFGIHSVCRKGFLSVAGDGFSTIKALMSKDKRAAMQVERFERDMPELMHEVPAAGEVRLLEPIGNHIRGTTFFDARAVVNAEMLESFRRIAESLPGVTFGRFDLKCASVEALRRGEVVVLEMNGVFGEPAHVYDPSNGIFNVYRAFWEHWKLIYRLHKAQLAAGVPTTHLKEALKYYKLWRQHKKKFSA